MGARDPRDQRKLPPGRHGIPADQVADDQRARILAAVVAAVGERGYAEATVEDFTGRAGVSRKTFYQHFANKNAAFLAAYDEIAERVVVVARTGYAAHDDYAASARAALERSLRELAADPDAAVLGVVEVFAAGPEALRRRSENIRGLTALITDRTRDLPQAAPGASFTAETIVGAVLEVVYNRVQRGEAAQLPDLVPDLLYCVVAPFFGHERATEERANAQRLLTS
ncbi:TetR/AcrR family transcriptional regulator [Saccharopolyspora dendranthemae]|uniref:TetR family transcriptional regulator n=1 Tax=Saccharopolyspora dendranthemae TaxID=1181886 RepID=A0A561U512_9PSEU|nr:TetR/AcrR family transcriptional regulator [Saccharopolyspora dendranthemae]TWF94444.1 TetR family transcriptional regulator [Saccharopolyspora dendranthemae]